MPASRFVWDSPVEMQTVWRGGLVNAALLDLINAALDRSGTDVEEQAGLVDLIEKAMVDHNGVLSTVDDLPVRVRRLLAL